MKRFILLLTILYPFCLFAQDTTYRPFIEEGKVWVSKCDDNLSFEGLAPERFDGQSYSYLLEYNYFDGDTIVDGRLCKRWVMHYIAPVSGKSLTYFLPVYEEDRKVWFYFDNGVGPFLIYDFGAKEGDTLVVRQPNIIAYLRFKNDESYRDFYGDSFWENYVDTLVVTSVSDEVHGGRIQQAMHFYSAKKKYREASMKESQISSQYIMAGIGTQWTPRWNTCILNNTLANWLIYCVKGDEILYADSQRAEYWNIPLPTSITSPRSPQMVDGKSVNSTWLDLSGRRLSASPTRPGVYLRDGRKVLVK